MVSEAPPKKNSREKKRARLNRSQCREVCKELRAVLLRDHFEDHGLIVSIHFL